MSAHIYATFALYSRVWLLPYTHTQNILLNSGMSGQLEFDIHLGTKDNSIDRIVLRNSLSVESHDG